MIGDFVRVLHVQMMRSGDVRDADGGDAGGPRFHH